MKTHDKEYFYKYVTAGTAKKIISNLRARWSSPILFNDPFDTQLKLRFGFEYDDLARHLTSQLSKLMFSETEPELDTSTLGYQIVGSLRRLRKKIPRTKWEEASKSVIKAEEKEFRRILEECSKDWYEFLLKFKVFCVAEEFDNLLMWAHYSENHSGVVIRFKCIEKFDTVLCAATPINYQTETPVYASLDEFVKHLTGENRINIEKKTNELIYAKSRHWSYEKEWRCITDREGENNQAYVMLEILPEEIDGLIMGCKISDKDKEEIINILEVNGLKHVEVVIAKKNEYRFALDFEKVT